MRPGSRGAGKSRRRRPASRTLSRCSPPIFVDRPRLAIVIAIVTTIAGAARDADHSDRAVSRHRAAAGLGDDRSIPAHPPAVVDATVAQPIESQVVGVDKLIYMKSVSGDDGSYTLTGSFELGTDPDINTVNVNNRVQVALSKLPQDVQRQGVTVKKKSSALLGVLAVYSPNRTHDPLFISNYVTINLLDQIKSTPGVGDATLWGPQDYAMRVWVQTDRLTGLDLTTGDIINAIQAQNVQAPVGRIGARPISDDQQLQLSIQTQGRLTTRRAVPEHRPAHEPGRLGAAPRRRRPVWSLAPPISTARPGSTAARRPLIAIYQSPGANAITTLKEVRARITELAKSFPEGLEWKVTYDPTAFITETIHEVQKTLIEAFVLVVIVVFLFLGSFRATLIPTLAVPVSLIGTFVVLKADRLLGELGLAARHGAGHRHRRRRCHRRGRERRARDGGASRAVARRGDEARDG